MVGVQDLDRYPAGDVCATEHLLLKNKLSLWHPSKDDSSNGRAVALYPADPGSIPAPDPYEITL